MIKGAFTHLILACRTGVIRNKKNYDDNAFVLIETSFGRKLIYSAFELNFSFILQTVGHLESMTQLLQEERDFYKRECELLRNMKEKSVLMSPPTRERVMNIKLLITVNLTLPLFALSSKTKLENN